jgi:hypothetical protein
MSLWLYFSLFNRFSNDTSPIECAIIEKINERSNMALYSSMKSFSFIGFISSNVLYHYYTNVLYIGNTYQVIDCPAPFFWRVRRQFAAVHGKKFPGNQP